MNAWVYALVATIVTAVIGWVKFGKLALLLAEIGQAVKATGDFLEEVAKASEDKKWTPEETQVVSAKAKVLWSEWKDVIGVFGKK